MPKPFEEWTVLPHGKLVALEENLLSVAGLLHMPLMESNRRMTVARLEDGRLVVFSPIALDEDEMLALERWGTVAFMIVPSARHRMDVKIWKARYPALTVVAPPSARAQVEELVPVDATEVDLGDSRVRYLVVPGTGGGEAALVVESQSGTTLVLNEIIFNLANRSGLGGWLMKAIGITGDEPHVPPMIKMMDVKDDAALGAQLTAWAELPRLKRVIISHGEVITADASAVLSRIARELTA